MVNISGELQRKTSTWEDFSTSSEVSGPSSTMSTDAITHFIEKIRKEDKRLSTRKNYYGIWKTFNQFIIKLDKKPLSWEKRLVLFVGNLINEGKKATTIRS